MSNKYRLVKLKECTGRRRIPFIGMRACDAESRHYATDRPKSGGDEQDHGDLWILQKTRSAQRQGVFLGMFVSAFLIAGLIVAWVATDQKSSIANLGRYVSSVGHGMFHREAPMKRVEVSQTTDNGEAYDEKQREAV